MAAHKIIAIYGSSGSYKSTTALALAHRISQLDGKADIVVIGTDTTKPLLPIVAPQEGKFKGSLGNALSVVDFDQEVLLKNIYIATGKIGILSYNIRENYNTYAAPAPARIDDMYMQMRHLVNYTIVDCTSDVAANLLTAKGIINADETVELLSCDLNGLVFDGSQEQILQSEQYGYKNFIRLLSLSNNFKQDEAAMKNALGRIRGSIPFSTKAAEYLNQGSLLYKGTDDRLYNTAINSLAKLLMEEE